MILYLDTSSLVKLYLEEEGSAAVRALVDHASVIATSVVAYPESRSGFARQFREDRLTDHEDGGWLSLAHMRNDRARAV